MVIKILYCGFLSYSNHFKGTFGCLKVINIKFKDKIQALKLQNSPKEYSLYDSASHISTFLAKANCEEKFCYNW